MIKVERRSRPRHFNDHVKGPGLAWLRTRRGAHRDLKAALPSRGAAGFVEDFWRGGDSFWRAAIPDLEAAYDEVCAYCALRIASASATSTVDHFVPKSQRPDLAFEWSNFRLASLRVNGKRGTKTVIDPFKVDGPRFRRERADKWRHYLRHHDAPYLRREAPHVYAEAERQGLLA